MEKCLWPYEGLFWWYNHNCDLRFLQHPKNPFSECWSFTRIFNYKDYPRRSQRQVTSFSINETRNCFWSVAIPGSLTITSLIFILVVHGNQVMPIPINQFRAKSGKDQFPVQDSVQPSLRPKWRLVLDWSDWLWWFPLLKGRPDSSPGRPCGYANSCLCK